MARPGLPAIGNRRAVEAHGENEAGSRGMPPPGQAARPPRAPTARRGNRLLCSPFRMLWLSLKVVTSTPSIRKLGLGTVQFGLPYGVTNARGQVPAVEVAAILAAALGAGIDLFATA